MKQYLQEGAFVFKLKKHTIGVSWIRNTKLFSLYKFTNTKGLCVLFAIPYLYKICFAIDKWHTVKEIETGFQFINWEGALHYKYDEANEKGVNKSFNLLTFLLGRIQYKRNDILKQNITLISNKGTIYLFSVEYYTQIFKRKRWVIATYENCAYFKSLDDQGIEYESGEVIDLKEAVYNLIAIINEIESELPYD